MGGDEQTNIDKQLRDKTNKQHKKNPGSETIQFQS
jgi:hypothetical protein